MTPVFYLTEYVDGSVSRSFYEPRGHGKVRGLSRDNVRSLVRRDDYGLQKFLII